MSGNNQAQIHICLKLLRPKHYLKNLFIFAPAFFAFHFEWLIFQKLLVFFLLFSMTASSIYILNDILDLEEDRQHPTKKNRPIAANKISVKKAAWLSFLLFFISMASGFFLSKEFFYILMIYFILNVFYSIKLKHVVIVDLIIIAIGFLLRLYAGSLPLDIYLSKWIIINTFMLTLLIGFSKRREDLMLVSEGLKTRKNVDEYNLEFLNYAVTILAGMTMVIYVLYTVSTEVNQIYHSENLYLTSFWVVLGIFYFLKVSFVDQKSSDPVEIFYKNNPIKIIVLLWLLTFYFIVKLRI